MTQKRAFDLEISRHLISNPMSHHKKSGHKLNAALQSSSLDKATKLEQGKT